MALCQYNSWTAGMKLVDRRRTHTILQILGSVLAITGSIIKMLDKTNNFNTTHGRFGKKYNFFYLHFYIIVVAWLSNKLICFHIDYILHFQRINRTSTFKQIPLINSSRLFLPKLVSITSDHEIFSNLSYQGCVVYRTSCYGVHHSESSKRANVPLRIRTTKMHTWKLVQNSSHHLRRRGVCCGMYMSLLRNGL